MDDLEPAPGEPAMESEAAPTTSGSPTHDSTSRVLIVLFIACILALLLVSQLASVVLAGGGGGCGGG